MKKEVLIDEESIIDLDPFVQNGHLDWRVPAGNESWRIFAFWEGFTNQVSCSGGVNGSTTIEKGSLVVDHFSAIGAKVHTSFFDRHIFSGKMTRKNLRTNGGYGELYIVYSSLLYKINRRQHGRTVWNYYLCSLGHEAFWSAFRQTMGTVLSGICPCCLPKRIRGRDRMPPTVRNMYMGTMLRMVSVYTMPTIAGP